MYMKVQPRPSNESFLQQPIYCCKKDKHRSKRALRLSCNGLPFSPGLSISLQWPHFVCGDPHSWQTNTKTTAISSHYFWLRFWTVWLSPVLSRCKNASLKEAGSDTQWKMVNMPKNRMFGLPMSGRGDDVKTSLLLQSYCASSHTGGAAGKRDNFCSLFAPNPTAVMWPGECRPLGLAWLCSCPTFMPQLAHLPLCCERA